MMPMKVLIKGVSSDILYWYLKTRFHLGWYNSDANRERLQALQGRHIGQRAFIIGSGPSIRMMDLSPLKNEITFGMNRIYLLFDTLNFLPTYYVAVNKYIVAQFADDIERLPMPKFLPWYAMPNLKHSNKWYMLDASREPLNFSTDIAQRIWTGATVTYVCLQIAFFMGIETVYLIGIDHFFQDTGPPHKLVTSNTKDINHFHPDYFGRGVRWQYPDLQASEVSYSLAQDVYEKNGRYIFDATMGGKLQVFEKVAWEKIHFDIRSQ
jgi:hypothetical protein